MKPINDKERCARRLRFAFLLGVTASSTEEIKDNAFETPKDREDLTNMMNLSPGEVNTVSKVEIS